MKLILKCWPIILLVFCAFVLRLIKLEELFYFTYDESVPAFVGRRLFLWNHIPLIGGVTPFGIHVTPYFYWFLSLVLYVGNLNPVAWGIAGAVFSIITTFFIYLAGHTLDGKKLGFLAASFWAFSYLANIYDRHLWALYPGPLIALATIFSLIQIIKGKSNYVYFLAIVLIFGMSADLSNLVFVAFSILAWIIYKIPTSKETSIAISLVALSFLPLLIFDLKHDLANSKPFFEFWGKGANNPGINIGKFNENIKVFPSSFSRLILTYGDNEISKQYSYCSSHINEKKDSVPNIVLAASFLVISLFIVWSYKFQNRPGWKLISLLTILYILGIQLYGTIFNADIFEHYITGLFPIFLLIFAKIISVLPKKIWLVALALFVAINLYKLSQAENSHGLKYKKEAIEFINSEVSGKQYSIDSLSTCWKYSGYRYLTAVFGKEPVKSYVDPNLGYLYGDTKIYESHPSTIVAFVTHDFYPESKEFYQRYALLKSKEIKSKTFGLVEVVILDNSSNWFER